MLFGLGRVGFDLRGCDVFVYDNGWCLVCYVCDGVVVECSLCVEELSVVLWNGNGNWGIVSWMLKVVGSWCLVEVGGLRLCFVSSEFYLCCGGFVVVC